MLLNFSESGHPVFRGTSALERRTLQSKGGAKLFVLKPLKWFLAFILSVNQLSIFGAVADMCDELASRISDYPVSMENLVAEDKPESMVSPTDFSTTPNPLLTSDRARENLLRENKQRFANLPDDLSTIKVCSDAGFKYTLPRDDNLSKAKGWTLETQRSVQYWR